MELDIQYQPKSTKDNGIEHCADLINFYRTPPFGQLTLEECEDLFRQRLEALSIIERTTDLSSNRGLTVAKCLHDIRSHVFKANCIVVRKDAQQRKLDHFSHMLVRMFCIYNANLWDWFKSCEKRLMNYRLRDQESSLSGSQIESFLKIFNFDSQRVTGAELNALMKEDLLVWNMTTVTRDIGDIFKVKFTDALKFVANRRVSLQDGYAFLTRREIISVVCDIYERHLDEELKYGRQHLNTELAQTQQLIESLSMVYSEFQEKIDEEKRKSKRDAGDATRSIFAIDIENVDELSKKHYPPCMRYMHESLREDHHLRHQGRLYYGAFLRSGQVDLDSAIEFWRQEFTKKITNERFERDYKYNIRHIYGKEGHKKALSCFSCDKIINDNQPGPIDKHGCPFKHFDDTHLRAMFIRHGVREGDIESILAPRREGRPKEACALYFQSLKGDAPTDVLRNPIHFYYESLRLANRPNPDSMDLDDEDNAIFEATSKLIQDMNETKET